MCYMISLFSFADAVHDHTSIGVRRGCVACAQTEADLALSKRALEENTPSAQHWLRTSLPLLAHEPPAESSGMTVPHPLLPMAQ